MLRPAQWSNRSWSKRLQSRGKTCRSCSSATVIRSYVTLRFRTALNNAAKYTPPSGRLALSVEATGRKVSITVSDNGIGMEAELVNRAFELFSQGSAMPTVHRAGWGSATKNPRLV
jgi:light-regulated signal transduction histidine kinase (bacteriophytochrome)